MARFKKILAGVGLYLLASVSPSHWSHVEPVDDAEPIVSSAVSTNWRCVDEGGATLFEADNTNEVINECVEIATTSGGRRTFGVERVDAESVLTRTLEHRVHGSTEVGLSTADAQGFLLIGGVGGEETGGGEAGARWAGLTPTHFVKHYTEIAGASSDFDTTTTDWSQCTVEDGSNFCTLGEAMQNCDDGDIIGIYAYDGIYVGVDNAASNSNPSWKCANGGTAGAGRITFVAERAAISLGGTPDDFLADSEAFLTAVLASANRTQLSNGVTEWTGLDPMDQDQPPTNGSPTFGCTTDYVRWIGVVVDGEVSKHHPDTGQAFFLGDNCELHQAVILGADLPMRDNNDPVRLNDADNWHGKNLIIARSHRVAPASDNHNAAGFMTYGSRNFLLEHVEIYDVNNGFYVKGQGQGEYWNSGTIRYARIRDVNYGGYTAEIHTGETFTFTESIVCNYDAFGLHFGGAGDPAQWLGTIVTNVTIGNPSDTSERDGIFIAPVTGGGHTIDNNIANVSTNGNAEVINGTEFVASNSLFDSINGNHGYASGGTVRFAWGGSANLNTAQFETASGATNTTSGNPDFTDEANCDFTLGGSTTVPAGVGAYGINANREIGLQASPTL